MLEALVRMFRVTHDSLVVAAFFLVVVLAHTLLVPGMRGSLTSSILFHCFVYLPLYLFFFFFKWTTPSYLATGIGDFLLCDSQRLNRVFLLKNNLINAQFRAATKGTRSRTGWIRPRPGTTWARPDRVPAPSCQICYHRCVTSFINGATFVSNQTSWHLLRRRRPVSASGWTNQQAKR